MWKKIPGPLLLFRTNSDEKLGGAWERGYPSLLLTHLQTWLHPHPFPWDTFLHPFETGYYHWQTLECSHSAYRTVSHSQVSLSKRVQLPPATSLQEHTHLTALMCSQLATPVFTPFCSLVRPCTVRSYMGKKLMFSLFFSTTIPIYLTSCLL